MNDDVLLSENPVLYFEQKRKKAVEEAPILMENGHKLIYPELHEEWDQLVRRNVETGYCGDEIKNALKIMTSLSMGASMEEAKLILDGLDKTDVLVNIVRDFDKKGPEFWLAVTPGDISVEDLKTLSIIKKRNNAIEKSLDNKQTYVNK